MKDSTKRLKETIFRHWAVIAFAILTTIIVASPQVYFRWDHRDDGIYQGIELLPDSFWSPRVREVMDGYPNFGSMYWKEGKDSPYLKQPLGSMMVAYMGEIFSLDINNTLLLSRIVLTFFTFLLIYWFVLLLSGSMGASISSAVVIILADGILDPRGLSLFLHGESPVSFIVFGQPVIPSTIQLPLFAFLIAFWFFLKRGGWKLGALCAVLLGSAFYNYFYLWTYLYAFGGLLGLFLLVRRQWNKARAVFLVYVGGTIVAIPYLINLHNVTLHPLYEEVSLRIGVLHTHNPLPLGIVVIASLIVFFLSYPRENREEYFFSLALIFTPLITLNQQLITGKILQAGHYHYYFHKPIAVVIVFVALFTFLAHRKLFIYKNALAVTLISTSVFVGVFVQYASYTRDNVYGGRIAIERQKYGPVMQWLSENADKDAVVLANDEVSNLVTIYTPQNVFYHRAAPYSSLMATKERLLDIVFTFYRLRNVDDTNVSEVFTNEREEIAMNVYYYQYQELFNSVVGMPDEQLSEIISNYRETLTVPTSVWLDTMFRKYEVEYLVWDKVADPDWQLDSISFIKEEATFGDISIYRVNSNTEVFSKQQ